MEKSLQQHINDDRDELAGRKTDAAAAASRFLPDRHRSALET